jgi:putative endonuclease
MLTTSATPPKVLSQQYKQNKHLANIGEDYVVSFLKRKGFSLVARNFSTRLGEVDAILRQGSLFIFVEVKTRNGNSFLQENIVSPGKQQRVISAAKGFLLSNQISLSDFSIRFDVAIVGLENSSINIHYIPSAFCA